uniref:Uncharacterized protein n=1 Tax=Noccaea caerulescens TaxID=107243 RepID=A0A1J3I265_NOCCA
MMKDNNTIQVRKKNLKWDLMFRQKIPKRKQQKQQQQQKRTRAYSESKYIFSSAAESEIAEQKLGGLFLRNAFSSPQGVKNVLSVKVH